MAAPSRAGCLSHTVDRLVVGCDVGKTVVCVSAVRMLWLRRLEVMLAPEVRNRRTQLWIDALILPAWITAARVSSGAARW